MATVSGLSKYVQILDVVLFLSTGYVVKYHHSPNPNRTAGKTVESGAAVAMASFCWAVMLELLLLPILSLGRRKKLLLRVC